jgi:hypothetical protein
MAELRAVRPLLAAAYGPGSAQVRNLDKGTERLLAQGRRRQRRPAAYRLPQGLTAGTR